VLLILAMAVLPALAQTPSKPDVNDIIHRVDDHYNHLSSLQARYSEHYAGMGMDRTETGTLLLKKPGRMRWSYDTPAGKLFILDGKNGWFYSPGDNQAQRISAKQLDDLRSPLRFLLGHTQLQKELDGVSVVPDADGYQIAGIPRGMAQRVKLLTLGVSPSGLIRTMRLEEVDGASTSFTFSNMQENVAAAPGSFVFTPPPGVTVVNGLPPI
jgi:outer membrane lipoprotein carrier protein